MNSKHLLSFGIAAVLVAGIAFYGGTLYAKGSSAPSNADRGARGGQFAGAGANRTFQTGQGQNRSGMGGIATGKIVSSDDQGITIELNAAPGSDTSAGSKVILTSDSTKIYKMSEGSNEDLSTDTNVIVTGTPNQDGSITAETIQIRPDGMQTPFGVGFGGRRPQGDQTNQAPTN